MKDIKHIAIVIVVGLALLLQLMNPTLVQADGEVTPQPSETSPEPTEPPVEVVLGEPPITTPIAPTVVPPQATPTPEPLDSVEVTLSAPEPTEPPPPSDVAVDEPVLLESVEGIPGTTSVNIVDENGQTLPLATQYAANAIENGDPIWCPAGQAPTPWINGCTGNLDFTTGTQITTLAQLLASYGSYINNQFVDGTIWITSGNINDTNPITIDGSTYTNWANYGLALQGGWSGISGDTSIGSNSIFTTSITISNWKNSVFIGNITTNQDVTISNTNGSNTIIIADVTARALNIDRTKSRIDIYNSTANLNVSHADINNQGLYSSGINISTLVGDVMITDSIFHGNGFDGVWMSNVNNVFIDNSKFYQNAYNGLEIYNAQSVTINNGTFNENGANGMAIVGSNSVDISDGTFKDNFFHGLYITETTGDITLNNIIATANPGTQGDGAYLDNTSGAGNITLTGTNDFSNHNPWNSGIFILSNGHVSLSGIISNNNGRGVNISQAGSVTITNGTFNDNVCDCEGSGVYVFSSGNVNIGQSAFYRNSLYIYSEGNVTVDTVTVDRSFGFGLGVDTFGGSVTINNSSFINTVADEDNTLFPWGDGADIFTGGGDVIISGSHFDGNAFDGLYLVAEGGNVTVDKSSFNENHIGGLDVVDANSIDISATEFTKNEPNYDLFASCASGFLSLIFEDSVPNFLPPSPVLVDILIDEICAPFGYSLSIKNPNGPPITVPQSDRPDPLEGISQSDKENLKTIPAPDAGSSRPPESFVEFFLCFEGQASHTVPLPNGDKVEIICPVSGKAAISRLDNITLPQELPEGYTFASGYEIKILQRIPSAAEDERVPIDRITEGGHIKVSFVAPAIQPGDDYSILYWDAKNGSWIPLKDYLRDANGLSHSFRLHAENPEDPMKILSGVEFLSRIAPPRVEVSTNFPGIFVLALR